MNPFENVDGLRLDGRYYSRAKLTSSATAVGGEEASDRFQRDILDFAARLVSAEPEVKVSTSGSTGTPKVISFPKSAVWKSAEATHAFFGLTAESRALLALPMTYIAGKMMVARALAGGYELISVAPCTNPLAEIGEGTRVDFAPFTPHQATVMARENPQTLVAIGTVLLGGGPVSSTLRQKLRAIGCRAFIGFGMAETLTHFAVASIGEEGEPVYRTLAGVSLSVDDRNRLVVERPGILNEPLHTGDVVELVKGGFRWLGRADNMINSGGVNVFPEAVEKKLAPWIDRPFFVAGVPHDTLGEQVTLFVEGEASTEPPDIAAAGLSRFETPRRTVFVERFLYTESGKVRRGAVVERWLGAGG